MNIKTIILTGFAAIGLTFVAAGTWSSPAQAQNVDEIVVKANDAAYCQGKDGRGHVDMTIVDGQGRKRTRQFTMIRLDEPTAKCGKQYYYVYFTRPADVNKTGFLVWKKPGKDDDRWLYLPALDLVKRIGAADKRTSFMGSHFLYEEISGRHIDADKHELVKTTDEYYVIKNTPKKPKEVKFSYYNIWVHKKTYLIVKNEFYNKSGKKYREFKAEKVETIQGYPTIMKQTMKDLQTGGYTTISFRKVQYDIGLPKDIFSERYLRKPPKKHLR
ncbi:MAG: outer membrane lipoprotein-sorting protein [Proteobacteria bacterium]|nr:outer membrane lipoprotein-sorting protein [Pseudomonadota bacterium]